MLLEPQTDEERMLLLVEQFLSTYKEAARSYAEYACYDSYEKLRQLEEPLRLVILRHLKAANSI